jgi:YbbR domain-containing protein
MKNRFFKKNVGLKIFSLTFAIILAWFANSDTNSSEIAFTLPVQIQNPPQDRVVLDQSANEVQLRVRGPSFIVSRLPSMSLSFKVRIPSDAGQEYKVTLEPDSLHLEPSVKVLAINPPTVNFQLDHLLKKDVPVIVSKLGTLPDSLHLDRIEISPAVISLSGPKSTLENINSVNTGPLELKTIKAEETRELPLQALGADIRFSDERVAVRVSVSPEKHRKFIDFPVELRTASTTSGSMRYHIKPQRVTVEVKGAARILDELRPEDVIPYVRVPDEAKTNVDLAVAVTLPDGVTLVAIAPPKVELSHLAGAQAPKKKSSAGKR